MGKKQKSYKKHTHSEPTHASQGEFGHKSVLFHEALDCIMTQHPKRIVVDGTLGLGGHSQGILEGFHQDDELHACDWDSQNFIRAQERLSKLPQGKQAHLYHMNYVDFPDYLEKNGVQDITAVLLDLGISSLHVDSGEAGFSFHFDGPLDMRYDRIGKGKTAQELLMASTESELFDILKIFGEEPKAYFIVQEILAYRKLNQIDSTHKLREIIASSSFDPKSIPRVFQAIRIALNKEFDNIRTAIDRYSRLLASGGRIAIISFHSGEDRIVKQCFAQLCLDEIDEITGQITKKAPFRKVTKKPIEPGSQELQENPRSRSAKLRCIEKL